MDLFTVLETVIRNRRSSKPALMNGKKIDDKIVASLLELADWAPTHGHTEPWRFIVYGGNSVSSFGNDHAELYKSVTPEEKFTTATYEKLAHNGDTVSHVILAVMKRGNNPKIPAREEEAAVAAAIEHILLGASALGIAALWSTGGLTHHPAMKRYLGLTDEDVVMGLLYLGYSDEKEKEGKRIIPLTEKVKWIEQG